LGARHVSPLTLEACLKDNPDRKPCIDLQTPMDQLPRGVARFAAGDPDGGPFTFLMGRMADGAWGYWLGSRQMTYILDTLPGDILTCGLGSEVHIRERPQDDAASLSTFKDLTELRADQFVLTAAGTYGVSGKRGDGWYHVVTPVDGWVQASKTTAAALGDCLLHDEVEQRIHG
jgi:hypothetical protein